MSTATRLLTALHTPDGLARTYGPEAALVSPELLPSFSCSVRELFA